MNKFVELNRIKYDDQMHGLWLNVDHIISFRKDPKARGSLIDVSFPDTMRAYKVFETPQEIMEKINKDPNVPEVNALDNLLDNTLPNVAPILAPEVRTLESRKQFYENIYENAIF